MSSSSSSFLSLIRYKNASKNLFLLESSMMCQQESPSYDGAVHQSLWKRLAIGVHHADNTHKWIWMISLMTMMMMMMMIPLLLIVYILTTRRQSPPSRREHHHRRRSRSDSLNMIRSFLRQQEDSSDSPPELEQQQSSLEDPWDPMTQRMPHRRRFQYPGGRTIQTIRYETLVPPPTWTEASRRLLPRDKIWNLQRPVVLDVVHRTIALGDSITKPGTHLDDDVCCLPLSQIGIHVVAPAECGALELYVQGAPREEWREHTFPSAAAAAQFQSDLLAIQFVGEALLALYQALELVHQGSMAYEGRELVLHDAAVEEHKDDAILTTEPSGICWDDAMRCLGADSPSIRMRLEALLWVRRTPRSATVASSVDPSKDNPSDTSSRLKPEYVGKRMLLGVVDFFRLFVPILNETATPHSATSRERMEQLLTLRKQVAQAARRVQAYVEARKVANLGWELWKKTTDPYWKKRLACDDNQDNARHDVNAKNEYYEPTVARDVLCPVRTNEHLKPLRWWQMGLGSVASPSLSHYQGYTLVGMHSFRWEPCGSDYPLQPNKDPVLAIPCLKKLIERNPGHQFFVHAYFAEGRRSIANVQVFVRSLPKGIDPTFDRNVDRFVRASATERRQRLECALQLGIDRQRLSWVARFMLSFLSFMMKITHRRKVFLSAAPSSHKRTTIPPINLSECGDTYHFGGSLQQHHEMPSNYVACATHLKSRRKNTLLARFLISYLECDGFSNDVTDFTYIFAGTRSDEVPERAVGTIRFVSYKLEDCALPLDFITENEVLLNKYRSSESCAKKTSDLRTLFNVLVVDPLIETFRSFWKKQDSVGQLFPEPREVRTSSETFHNSSILMPPLDLYEEGINEIVGCLGNVTVPLRKGNRLDSENDHNDFIHTPILQLLDRHDIRRYLVGSDGSIKIAAVRIVQSTCWRNLTFPINTRACRVELQSGQFFQQGRDIDGFPVFYFRNICLGPWRKNEDATIAAVLHRLEASLNILSKTNPTIKCTLIILAGTRRKQRSNGEDRSVDEANKDDEESTAYTVETAANDLADYNPRVHQNAENWYAHSNRRVLLRLIDIVINHYPERLSKALIVVGHDRRALVKTLVSGKLALSVAIQSPRTRDKVRFLRKFRELQEFVDKDILVKFAGGNAPVKAQAFECA